MSHLTAASSEPALPASRRTTLLALLAVLAACAVPLFIELGTRDSTNTMEQLSLLSSQETWHRMHDGEAGAWLMPTNNGKARIQKPPLLVWLNLLAWSDLDPSVEAAQLGELHQTLVHRSRLVGASLTLLMIAAIFWLGLTLGDLRLAVLSSLIAGTTIFLQRQGRMATYDIHMTAWVTAAVAAALWAMQPFRPTPTRAVRVAGWSLAGLFTAAALMSKSPLALPLFAAPVMIVIGSMHLNELRQSTGVDRRRWRTDLAGLAAAMVICILLVTPWFIFALRHVSEAEQTLLTEYAATREKSISIFYYVGVFVLVAPWTLWLVGGLVHPFTGARGTERRLRMMAWLWFVLILAVFSLHPEAKKQRYILPIVPAAALLAAQVWCDLDRRAKKERPDLGAVALANAHWVALTLASLAAGFMLAEPQRLVDWHWAEELPVAAMSWPLALGIGAMLAALSILGWRRHAQQRTWAAGVITAAWTLVMMTAFWQAHAHAPTHVSQVRHDAQRVSQIIGSDPMRYLLIDENLDSMPEEEFRFYTGRIIPPVRLPELHEFAAQGAGAAYVLARDDDSVRQMLRTAGFHSLGQVREDVDRTAELWCSVEPQ